MLESWGPGIGFGRVDQYLFPFYERDISRGVLTRDDARELIALFLIKVNELIMPFPAKKGGGRSAGLGTLSGMTLGGLSRDGTKKAEELTRLFLEAEECVMMGEDLSFRVHPSMSEGIVFKACELAKNVRGKIKFISDETVFKQQLNDGKPIDMALDYAVTGCFVHTVPGQSHDPGVDAISLPYIAIIPEKFDSTVFFNELEELLAERYPTAIVSRVQIGFMDKPEKLVEKVLGNYDVWIEGVKTSGAWEMDRLAALEKAGVPGVTISIEDLVAQRRRLATVNGLPGLRIVALSSEKFFTNETSPEKII
jgi:hypothetical protein